MLIFGYIVQRNNPKILSTRSSVGDDLNTEMLRSPVMKSVSSMMMPQESLWWERFVKEVGFGPEVKEIGSCNVLLANIVTFTVISVITQMATSVPQTTEVVALTPTAATLQEAALVPVSQDTPGMESDVQVCRT